MKWIENKTIEQLSSKAFININLKKIGMEDGIIEPWSRLIRFQSNCRNELTEIWQILGYPVFLRRNFRVFLLSAAVTTSCFISCEHVRYQSWRISNSCCLSLEVNYDETVSTKIWGSRKVTYMCLLKVEVYSPMLSLIWKWWLRYPRKSTTKKMSWSIRLLSSYIMLPWPTLAIFNTEN